MFECWRKEPLLKGKAQYSSPCTNQFSSAIFYIVNIITFYKTSYPNEEVNCTKLSTSVSVTCGLYSKNILTIISDDHK
jgi:hypothetical protein